MNALSLRAFAGRIRTQRRALTFACALLSPLACSVQPLAAQTLKDTLKQHMREGIEHSEEKQKEKDRRAAAPAARETAPPEKKPAPAPKPEAHPQPKPDSVVAFSIGGDDGPNQPVPETEKPPGPSLPVRVFGKNFKLDITIGAGYRGWYPQQYRTVDVDIGSYATWNIDVKAKLFKFLNLRRGYYESSGISGPRTEEAAVAARIGSFVPKAVWLLGILGVPVTKVWEPQIRYESRAFETTARPQQDVCVVDRKAPEDARDCPGSMGDLKIISSFETLVGGVRWDSSKQGSPVVGEKVSQKIPPIFFGIGLMQYRKPYQLNVDGYTLDNYLFDARFRGAGLALGTNLGGGLDNFYSDIDVQFGLGEASLTDKISLNELIPNGQLLGYVQGLAALGYRWVLIHAAPTLIFVPQVSAGGASFFLVDTKSHTGDEATSTSPNVNWDFLWSVQASLLLPL
jgi:hypothetical protein